MPPLLEDEQRTYGSDTEIPIAGSDAQMARVSEQVDQLNISALSGLHSLREDIQRNRGDLALSRAEVAAITTQIKQKSTQGEILRSMIMRTPNGCCKLLHL